MTTADDTGPTGSGARREELRIALGLRGGVSLAVWIGGASAEIDELRCGSHRPSRDPEDFWSGLADLTQCEVVVDVMAGASAGGLNAVIYAASQIYGFEMEDLKGVWQRCAQLHDMARPRGAPAVSLLDGDGVFLQRLHEELTSLVEHGAPPDERPRIDLFLTATLVEPIRRSLPSEGDEPLHEDRYTAGFHFLHLGTSPWLTDFCADDQRARTLWQLAVAGRSTSSFPVAFEAAAVRASRPRTFADESVRPPAGPATDLRDIFTESRIASAGDTHQPDDTFIVCDGGVLDNIPLGRAIRAVEVAAADRPTRRVLVYVQPGEPSPPRAQQTAASVDDRRSVAKVLRAVYGAKVGTETIADDVDLLERYNGRVAEARAIRAQTLGTVDPNMMVTEAELHLAAYQGQVIDVEVAAVCRLLEDPVGTIGKDVFPASIASADDGPFRSPLASWTPTDRARLAVDLGAVLQAQERVSRVDDDGARALLTRGLSALRRTTARLLSWALLVEASITEAATLRDIGERKRSLYQTLLLVDLVLARSRQFGWVVAAVRRADAPLDAWCGDVLASLDRLLLLPDNVVRRAADFLRSGDLFCADAPAVTDLRRHCLRGLDDLVDRLVVGPGSGPDVRHVLLDEVLVPAATDLARLAGHLAVAPDDPTGHLHRLLVSAEHTMLRRLGALEVLDLPHALFGTIGDRPIEYVRLSAAAPTAGAPAFTALWDATARRHRERHLPPPEVPAPGPRDDVHPWIDAAVLGTPLARIPVEEKLAGNELGNFGAFLREDWRSNDWMWGRLDAVPTLVQLLVTPERLGELARRLRRAGPGPHVEPERIVALLATQVHSLVVGAPSDGPPDVSWSAFRERALWRPFADAVSDELAQIVAAAAADVVMPPGLSVAKTVAALSARRQWDLLAEELGAGDPRQTLDRVAAHAVGAEAISDDFGPKDAALVRDLVGRATSVLDRTVATAARETEARWRRPTRVAGTIAKPVSALLVRGALSKHHRNVLFGAAVAVTAGGALAAVKGAQRDPARLVALGVTAAGAITFHRFTRPLQ